MNTTKVPIRKECSKRTMEYLYCIKELLLIKRVSPTIVEIASAMSVSKTAANKHIIKLIESNQIEVDTKRRILFPAEWIDSYIYE